MKICLTDKLHHAIKDKEHIIWDWNGTLLDDVSHAVNVMNFLLEEHKLPLIDREHYRKIFDFAVLNYILLGLKSQKKIFLSM